MRDAAGSRARSRLQTVESAPSYQPRDQLATFDQIGDEVTLDFVRVLASPLAHHSAEAAARIPPYASCPIN